jgi:hypothetical protein
MALMTKYGRYSRAEGSATTTIEYSIPKAFCGQHVALRPTQMDGILEIFFGNQLIQQIDWRNPH